MTGFKHFIIDSVYWIFWWPFRWAIKKLPLMSRYAVAHFLARLLYPFARKEIQKTLNRLAVDCAQPWSGKDLEKAGVEGFDIYVKRHFEDLFMGSLSTEDVANTFEIKGLDHLEKGLEQGNGVILQVAHFGSFRMVLPALSFRGYRVNQIVGVPELKHHRHIHRRMFEAIKAEDGHLPVRFIHPHRSIRPAVRALKANEILVIALDGRDGKDWVCVPFLGRSANLSPGSIRLAQLTGAMLLPTFMIRQSSNCQTLILEPPVILETHRDQKIFRRRNMHKLARIFEKYILDYPSHFVMTLTELRRRSQKGIIDTPLFNDEKQE